MCRDLDVLATTWCKGAEALLGGLLLLSIYSKQPFSGRKNDRSKTLDSFLSPSLTEPVGHGEKVVKSRYDLKLKGEVVGWVFLTEHLLLLGGVQRMR